MANPFARTAAWTAAHPWWTALIVLVAVAGIGAGMSQADDSRIQTLFVPDNLEAQATLEKIEDIWGPSEATFFLYLVEDPTDPELVRAVAEDMDRLAAYQDTQSVAGLPALVEAQIGPLEDASDAEIRSAAQSILTSPDGARFVVDDALLVRIALDPPEDVIPATSDLDEIAAASGADADLRSTGGLYIERSQQEGADADVSILMPLSVVAIALLLALMFRRVQDVLVPMVTVFLSLILAYGTVAWVGLPLAPPSFIVMPLLLGLGIDYMLHIVYSYREQDKSLSVAERFRGTGNHIGFPVFFTALTTLIGFGSFLASSVPQIRVWGLLIGSGAMYAFLLGFVALPAMYRLRRKKERPDRVPWDGAMRSVTALVLGRRKMVLLTVGILTLGLGIAATQINIERQLDFEPDSDDPAVVDLEAMEERFGGQTLAMLLIEAGPRADLESLEDELASTTNIGFVDGPIHRLERVGEPEGDLSDDRLSDLVAPGHWRILVGYPDRDQVALDGIRAAIDASPLEVDLTGQLFVQQESEGKVLDSLFLSTMIALVLVLTLLFVVFRRPIIAMLAFSPLVVTVCWQLGVQTLTGIPLNAVTGVMTAMIIGVGIDYSLHIMSHFQSLRMSGQSSFDAARGAMESVGRPVLAASISTVGAFSVLAFSSFVPLRHFGIVAAIVVTCAFFVSLTMLPVLASYLPDRWGLPQSRATKDPHASHKHAWQGAPHDDRVLPAQAAPEPGHALEPGASGGAEAAGKRQARADWRATIHPHFEDPDVQEWFEGKT